MFSKIFLPKTSSKNPQFFPTFVSIEYLPVTPNGGHPWPNLLSGPVHTLHSQSKCCSFGHDEKNSNNYDFVYEKSQNTRKQHSAAMDPSCSTNHKISSNHGCSPLMSAIVPTDKYSIVFTNFGKLGIFERCFRKKDFGKDFFGWGLNSTGTDNNDAMGHKGNKCFITHQYTESLHSTCLL
jgi:hypothetical protein